MSWEAQRLPPLSSVPSSALEGAWYDRSLQQRFQKTNQTAIGGAPSPASGTKQSPVNSIPPAGSAGSNLASVLRHHPPDQCQTTCYFRSDRANQMQLCDFVLPDSLTSPSMLPPRYPALNLDYAGNPALCHIRHSVCPKSLIPVSHYI